uniref:Uncharacterized protein n=1 Tax=Arundo donax TaxID=35708 RepID=A0A0A9CKC1_ARUDO
MTPEVIQWVFVA